MDVFLGSMGSGGDPARTWGAAAGGGDAVHGRMDSRKELGAGGTWGSSAVTLDSTHSSQGAANADKRPSIMDIFGVGAGESQKNLESSAPAGSPAGSARGSAKPALERQLSLAESVGSAPENSKSRPP
eukprot:1075527-Pyramimonas_sp.AAC.1